MTADSRYTSKIMLVPDSYVFLDAKPAYAVVIHKTASPGMSTAEQIAQYFINGSDGRHVSAHYVVGKDGTVIQCVREKDGSGANAGLPKEEGRNTLFDLDINWNLRTISIEHVDDSTNNSQELTPAQKKASFNLVKDICTRHGISHNHVVEHKDIQPKSKPHCAGNYPMSELIAFLNEGSTQMSVKQNKNGEVCDVVTDSQFLPGKTEFACGFVASANVRYAGEPGKGPTGTATDVARWWEAEYIREYGSDGANIVGGVSIDDMHRLLVNALPNSGNSHYVDLAINANTGQASDMANIHGALASGYPVVCTVTEASIRDVELGKNPYWWGASGKHVFLITGMKPNGDLLVHDPANVVGALQGANTPRPQPRTYDHTLIDITWASMVRFPWLVPFPTGWLPTSGTLLNQIEAPKPVAPPVQGPNTFNDEVVNLWELITPGLPRNTPIFASWRIEMQKGNYRGSPLGPGKKGKNASGKEVTYYPFNKGTAEEGDGGIKWL